MKYQVEVKFDNGDVLTGIPHGEMIVDADTDWVKLTSGVGDITFIQKSKIRSVTLKEIPSETDQAPN